MRSSAPVDFPFRFTRARSPARTPVPASATPGAPGSAREFQEVVAHCQAQLEERARFLCRGRNPSDAKDL
ncbi:MAG TPA: RNA polymerase sigma factor, partial [Cystobacter sp.]